MKRVISVGRDDKSSRLSLVLVEGDASHREAFFGEEGSVPSSVSREHCKIEFDDVNNKCRIHNSSENNRTYVNDTEVESKAFNFRVDKVTLGGSGYALDLVGILQQFNIIPPDGEFPIKPLRGIWTGQQSRVKAIDRNYNLAVRTISMSSILITAFRVNTENPNPTYVFWMYVTLVVLAIIAIAMTFYKYSGFVSARFKKKYVCPHCEKYLGNISYEQLLIARECPHCKARFKHK